MARDSVIFRHPVRILLLLYIAVNIATLAALIKFKIWGMLVFALNGFLMPAWLGFYAHAIQNDLRSKGYEWIGFIDSWRLYCRHWQWAFRIPPRSHLAQIPGYTDSVDGVTLALRPIMLEKMGAYTLYDEGKRERRKRHRELIRRKFGI